MYNWALNNEILDKIPNLKAIEKIAVHKIERPIFETSDIEKLIRHANPQMKAMILLGLNCGFGCTDCVEPVAQLSIIFISPLFLIIQPT